jgi:hypothetical protein
MRTFLALLLSAVIGFVVAYWLLGSRHDNAVAVAPSSDTTAGSEKGLRFSPSPNSREVPTEMRVVTRTIYTTGTNKLAARDVLELLLKLHPNAGEESRNRIFRQIIYYLQTLAQMGPESVPVIQEFLKKNQDVDYSGDLINASGERISRPVGMAFASRNLTRTDFIVPPSLRLGLVDVLEQIGTPEATGVLVEMLDTTGRGIEVAYLARILQDQSPDEYRENALKAAKDLLANPPTIDRPNRLDENSRAYLYSVLAMFNDTSFAETAQSLLVSPEGHVDRQAMNYLSNTLKEQAVPALYSAYKNEKLTNQTERTQLLNTLLAFTGPSAQANEVFKEIVTDEKVPATIRGFSIQNLAGAPGRDRPSDPQLIEARLQFLRTLRDSFTDERLLKAIDETRATLEQLKNGVALQ